MSKSLAEKKSIVEKISKEVNNKKLCLFVKQNQISGMESVEIRKSLEKINANTFCIKNTLLKRVLSENNHEVAKSEGSFLMVSGDNEWDLRTTVKKLEKEVIGLELSFSVINKQLVNKEWTKKLSKHKSQDDLSASVFGNFMIPVFQLCELLEFLAEQKKTQ